MAYELVAEVLDHAPEMTPGEALVLVAIAEAVRAPGQSRAIRHPEMLRRARMGPRGLRQVLARLAARGIEVRVPLGTDKRGEPIYAVPGKAPTYRLPPFPAPPGCDCQACSTRKAAPGFPLHGKAEPRRRQPEPQFRQGGTTVPAAGTTVPPSPSVGNRAVRVSARCGRCRDGWLGEEDRPIPCPTCRPATAKSLARHRT